MTAENFDIRRLRNPYESNAEWRQREAFLTAHKGKYSVHRLLCLSNCYINSEVYGSRYPDTVMQELRSLKSQLPQPTVEPNRKMGIEKVKFVQSVSTPLVVKTEPSSSKSENVTSPTINTSPSKPKTVVEYKIGVAKKPSPTKFGVSTATAVKSTPTSSGDATSIKAEKTTGMAGSTSVTSGTTSVNAGTTSVKAGTTSVNAGTTSVKAGTTSVKAGTTSVKVGTTSVKAGTTSVTTGMTSVTAKTTSVTAGKTSVTAGMIPQPKATSSNTATTADTTKTVTSKMATGVLNNTKTQATLSTGTTNNVVGEINISKMETSISETNSNNSTSTSKADSAEKTSNTAMESSTISNDVKDSFSKTQIYSFPPNYVPKRIAADWEPKNPTPVFKQNVPKPKPKSLKDAQRFNPDVVNPRFADFMMPIDQKFFTLAQTYQEMQKKNPNFKPIDILPIAGMKCKMGYMYKFDEVPAPKGLHKFVCILICENVEVGVGQGGNKKAAKKNSVINAGEKLSKHYLKVSRVNPERQELQASDEYFTSAWSLFETNSIPNNAPVQRESNAHVLAGSKKRKFSEIHGDLNKFLLIEPLHLSASDNARSILQQSADFNKALLEYEFHNDSTGVRCRLQLEGQTLIEFFGTTRAATKLVAAEKALEGLRKICWTIKIKQAVDTDDVGLTRDSVLGDIQKQVECISEDNIGNQMLRKMGWTGGGVGAEGNKGREVPVAVDLKQVIRREGLGAHGSDDGAMKNFREKAKDIIDNYAKSDRQDDLVFAPNFTKDERAFIHQHAQKYGLKTQSRGSGEERYLTVGRKRTADQLFNHLVQEGGSTSKYELVPPGQGGIIYDDESGTA